MKDILVKMSFTPIKWKEIDVDRVFDDMQILYDADYIVDTDETRDESLDYIIKCFPDGMFTKSYDGNLIYRGGMKKFAKKIGNELSKLANADFMKNPFANWQQMRKAVHLLKYPIDTIAFDWVDKEYGTAIITPYEFFEMLDKRGHGKKIYIGDVKLYHH